MSRRRKHFPALAAATVGIVMGTGTGVAMLGRPHGHRRRQAVSAWTPHVRRRWSVQRLGWAAQLALVLNGMNMPAGLSR